jgi:hypothetical protein
MMVIFKDILVAGGGIAGVAAAVAAARTGCSVVLIERENLLGGTGRLGMLGTICGLYPNGGEVAGRALNGGITQELIAGLSARAPRLLPVKVGKVFVLPYAPADLQHELQSLCSAERSLEVITGSAVVSANVESGTISKVVILKDDREQNYIPEVVIDCTGDGELSCMAGAGFDEAPSEQRQLGGYVVSVRGIANQDDSFPIKVPFLVARGVEAGKLPLLLRFTVFSRGDTPDAGYLKINIQVLPELSAETLYGAAEQLLAYLAQELADFSDAFIDRTSDRVMPREGRRIIGEYMLTAEDVLSCRKFDDGLVRGAWPIELWEPHKGVSYRYPADGDYYEVPLRCLKAKGFTNLFMAGRCISASREALGSTRVMGCCLALGEQAGIAAALLCRGGV